MRAAQQLTGEPALALHYGEALDLSELSVVGLIARASETMVDAFAQLNRYAATLPERCPVKLQPARRAAAREPSVGDDDVRVSAGAG
jgi:hypothetical protein